LSSGYGGFILAQRLAFNAMTWKEWVASLLYCLPDRGWGVPGWLFGTESVMRMGWGPSGFYSLGNGSYMVETMAAAGGRAPHLSYLMQHELKPNLFWHLMVTLPLAERGLWVGKNLGVLGFVLIIPVGRALAQSGRLLPYLFVVAPLMSMVLFHGFVTIGVPRYNVPLLTLYGFTIAYAAADLAQKLFWPHSNALADTVRGRQ
jgi:hypothetical protein